MRPPPHDHTIPAEIHRRRDRLRRLYERHLDALDFAAVCYIVRSLGMPHSAGMMIIDPNGTKFVRLGNN